MHQHKTKIRPKHFIVFCVCYPTVKLVVCICFTYWLSIGMWRYDYRNCNIESISKVILKVPDSNIAVLVPESESN